MARYEFATIVSGGAALVATHVPVAVRREASGLVISGRLARADDHWKLMHAVIRAGRITCRPRS